MAFIIAIGGKRNLTGTKDGDRLVGDDRINLLEGLGGADVINGGENRDWAVYTESPEPVMVDLSDNNTEKGGDAAGDTLISIENLRGSAHDDTLTGDDGENRLEGGVGADTLDGGAGRDWAVYNHSDAPVMVDLSDDLTEKGGDAAGDTLYNIERLRGSRFDDTLTGDENRNVLQGGAGKDTLNGGEFDNDDQDWAWYQDSPEGVTVDLAAGTGDRRPRGGRHAAQYRAPARLRPQRYADRERGK